jgi:multiple sugar transport system permease protein
MSSTRTTRGSSATGPSATGPTVPFALAGRHGHLWGRQVQQNLTLLAFLLPAIAYVALFFAYPLYRDIVISFQDYGFTALTFGRGTPVGLANYGSMLSSPVTLGAIINTAIFTAGSIVFQFAIGFGMALYLQRKFLMAGVLRRIMLVPWVMPLVTTGTIFSLIFATSNGLANEILRGLGIIHTNIGWLDSGALALAAITIANVWAGVPFNAVLLYSGLQDVPSELLEAASMDGANAWQRFVSVTVPSMRQVILIVLMLGVVYTVKAFDLVIVLTGGGPDNESQLLSSWAYTQAFTQFQFGTGTAVGNILLVFCFVVGLIYLQVSRGSAAEGGFR